MSEKVHLTRARVVELKHKSSAWPAAAINVSAGHWEVSGSARVRTTDELLSRFDIVEVLDELPEPTLADLLPEGCTEFRFNSAGFRSLAVKKLNGAWEVTGMHGDWTDLNELAFDAGVDLSTVVPLTVDPDWIEAQR